LAQTLGETSGIHIDLEAHLGEDRLPTDVETTIYRVIQEALTNVFKHAQSTRVSILLVRRENIVTAVVEDNGVGFDAANRRSDSFGLEGMRERVELHEGRMVVETSPGAGTTLRIEVPL
jgi:signal transduction histidine kinase